MLRSVLAAIVVISSLFAWFACGGKKSPLNSGTEIIDIGTRPGLHFEMRLPTREVRTKFVGEDSTSTGVGGGGGVVTPEIYVQISKDVVVNGENRRIDIKFIWLDVDLEKGVASGYAEVNEPDGTIIFIQAWYYDGEKGIESEEVSLAFERGKVYKVRLNFRISGSGFIFEVDLPDGWEDAFGDTIIVGEAERHIEVSVAGVPVSQNIVTGANGVEFANYIFDATKSQNDVSLTGLELLFGGLGDPTGITNCLLYDGETVLSSGENTVNPTAMGEHYFSFDKVLVVPAGTKRMIILKGDVSRSVGGHGYHYSWGLAEEAKVGAGDWAGTTEIVIHPSPGPTMTVLEGGALSVTIDPVTPPYRMVLGLGMTSEVLSR